MRGFDATSCLDGLQSCFGYSNNVRPKAFPLESVSAPKGPLGDALRRRRGGGAIYAAFKLPNPNAPNIVQLEFGPNKLFQSNIDLGGALGDGRFNCDCGYALQKGPIDPFAAVSENQASAWLECDFAGKLAGLQAGFGVRHVGETENTGVTPPDVTLYDGVVGCQLDRCRVALTGRNLADKAYVVDCSPWTCYYGDARAIGLILTAAF